MSIFAIGRNYAAHIEELNNERPKEPLIFTKPDTAILRHNESFYYPDFSTSIHYETEIVLRISKGGRRIAAAAAALHYDAVGIGIDFTARDLQQRAKEKGLPWAIAKGFDGSAPISDIFLPLKQLGPPDDIRFTLEVDGVVRQRGHTRLMLFPFDYLVAYLSRFFTLRPGDLIFTGAPEGVGPVAKGNRLTAYIEDKKMLDFEVK